MKQSMPKKIASGAIRLGLIVTILIAFSLVWDNLTVVADGEPDALRDHVPRPGVFPPRGAGVQLDGDLVVSDPVNRRGALRKGRNTPRHYFAMLPYGMVWYHGAPADVRHIPTGTHMHGQFLLPMKGEEETIPPVSEKEREQNPLSRYNHAILLEDDVSFYSRRGRSWKILGTEQGGGPAPRLKLSVEPVGPDIDGGINKTVLLDIDASTRVWKNSQIMGIDQLIPGQQIQVNLTWGPFDSLATTDIWLDDASLKTFKEVQRQRHLRLIRSRFLPGWVDAVKNGDTGGGEVTVTFFGGMDPSLYTDIRDMQGGKRQPKICNAETTLRTWGYHQEYATFGDILEWKVLKNPPFGSSGFQIHLKVSQMLDGFRLGRIVRAKGPWTYVLIPHDECIMTAEDLKRSRRMILP
ncbi:hypothetical protein CMK22_06460 [Candidatus Poribacteria bacterium]|nr:hypothetical protein [Candidatus Poribacteria bacterium]